MQNNWIYEFNGAITLCDKNGIIIDMNEKSAKTFEADGGYSLIGKNLSDCHPDLAKTKLKKLMDSKKVNAYTIEKNGKKKLIYQSPWYENGEYMGIIELSLEIPFDMPHFVRE
jgi:transcriptional regulator with PAS, ATPase and Fis domain